MEGLSRISDDCNREKTTGLPLFGAADDEYEAVDMVLQIFEVRGDTRFLSGPCV